jgi:hypothetical protein
VNENRLTSAMARDRMEMHAEIASAEKQVLSLPVSLPQETVMTNHANHAAGIHAAAGVARLHAGLGICAYPWQIGTTAPVVSMHNAVTTDSKLRHRWPQEPSP